MQHDVIGRGAIRHRLHDSEGNEARLSAAVLRFDDQVGQDAVDGFAHRLPQTPAHPVAAPDRAADGEPRHVQSPCRILTAFLA